MREIKFRAWNRLTATMVDLQKITPLALAVEMAGLFIPFSDDYILMQYTGLKDSKRTEEYPEGQEIYEGSTVKAWIYGDEEPQILDVRWHASGGFVIDYRDAESDMVLVGDFVGSLEVIGNIYEGES